jgi:hypothetical protein
LGQTYRLPAGRFCLRVPLGQCDSLAVDAFIIVAYDYPFRPPEVMVACGRQRLEMALPSLDAWTVDTPLTRIVEEVVMQVPGLNRRQVLLTPEGDLAPGIRDQFIGGSDAVKCQVPNRSSERCS